MNRFLAILLAFCFLLGSYHFVIHKSFINPYPVVCGLVSKKIFLDDDQLKKWKNICNSRSRLVTAYSPRNLIIRDINNVLGLLNVSHLELYDSSQVKSIWQGENLETGIESEFVDSELVVFKVHPNSPAHTQGVKKGDVIKNINNEQPNPWDAQTLSGTYVIKRGNSEESLALTIQASTIVRAEGIEVERIRDSAAVIRIPSFRASFFEAEKLQVLGKNLQGLKHLVIDLRGNIGGNFVAGLRFLSMMMCSPEEVGRLIRPRAKNKLAIQLPDDLRDETQLAYFEKYREIILKTSQASVCYRGDIVVLVDGKTASVAEMVAQAMKEFRRASVLGSPSRGQLLVGVWYPLQEVGPGVEISIPEAFYLSHKKRRIEGQGVELDKILYYDLNEMQAGIDSWIKMALAGP